MMEAQVNVNDPSEVFRMVGDRVAQEEKEFKQQQQPEERPAEITSKEILKALNSNEDGDASLFVRSHKGKFCFDHSGNRWYSNTEHYWKEDVVEDVIKGMDTVINLYGEEAARQQWLRLKAEKDGDTNAGKQYAAKVGELFKRIHTLQGRRRKDDVLYLAACGTGSLGIVGNEWDLDPWLLGCLNGVLDLRSGVLRHGDANDFIKTVAPVEWKGIEEPCPTWERTLLEIADQDEEVVAFQQRYFGYCLTGKTNIHVYVILWGAGRNGKGTTLETLAFTLGSYAGQVEGEFILKQRFNRQSGGPTSDIMSLRGKRLVWASEIDDRRRLNAGRVKWLSGGDTLTGREMYGRRQVSFQPSHKIMLLTNHRPHVDPSDYALWKRIHLIPFKLAFIEGETKEPHERAADPDLPDKLRAEASGILAWLVRGCLAWQQEGLKPPACIVDATEEYRKDEDLIQHFIDEKCEVGDGLEVKASKIQKGFAEWCGTNGVKGISGIEFGKQMKQRFLWEHRRGGNFYIGVSYSPPAEEVKEEEEEVTNP